MSTFMSIVPFTASSCAMPVDLLELLQQQLLLLRHPGNISMPVLTAWLALRLRISLAPALARRWTSTWVPVRWHRGSRWTRCAVSPHNRRMMMVMMVGLVVIVRTARRDRDCRLLSSQLLS